LTTPLHSNVYNGENENEQKILYIQFFGSLMVMIYFALDFLFLISSHFLIKIPGG